MKLSPLSRLPWAEPGIKNGRRRSNQHWFSFPSSPLARLFPSFKKKKKILSVESFLMENNLLMGIWDPLLLCRKLRSDGKISGYLENPRRGWPCVPTPPDHASLHVWQVCLHAAQLSWPVYASKGAEGPDNLVLRLSILQALLAWSSPPS